MRTGEKCKGVRTEALTRDMIALAVNEVLTYLFTRLLEFTKLMAKRPSALAK